MSNSFTDASRDVIIRDVFAGDSTPIPLTTVEFSVSATVAWRREDFM
ncbi:Spermidine synthase-like protein [Corynebacterium pseudotuberculosis]|nr:Spermidine synthase-like protein [Corynebacterium pseudotuberculosis]AIG08166.1 Spermidine synthase-like protein [Corynebacterium pseudotuberculosis]AIG11700.1 Spermidine synthase-like protein [Corynebacterium pseudotuberculosis]